MNDSNGLYLEALKRAYMDRDEADRPAYITEGITPDGTIRARPLTMLDILDYVERECRGEVGE